MKFLTPESCRAWAEAKGLGVTPGGYLYYHTDDIFCLTVGTKEEPHDLTKLANCLVPLAWDFQFDGALLWINERGIWNEHSENLGELIMRRIRFGSGESESIEKHPGCLFESNEQLEMHAQFIVPIFFLWDAFLVPERGDYFVFVHHHAIISVVSRTKQIQEELRTRLTNWGWSPKEDTTWYSGFFRPRAEGVD